MTDEAILKTTSAVLKLKSQIARNICALTTIAV